MNSTAPVAHRLAFVLSLLCAAVPATAFDTLVLEGGTSEGRVDVDRYGGALRWDLPFAWLERGDWGLVSYLEFSITYWESDRGTTGHDDLVDFGLTPVLRWQRDPDKGGVAPFLEAGIGAHGHTHSGISDRDFGIPFAFGSHVGAGARFGTDNRYELVYRFQHLSNAGIDEENPGINFHVVQLGYHF